VSISRTFLCLSALTFVPFAAAQSAPPTSYAITEAVNGGADGGTTTIYRSGDRILMEFKQPAKGATPAQHTLSYYDLSSHTNWTWVPEESPISCNAGTFSGDWGDPFAASAELNADIAKGDLKPTGTATLAGVSTQVYAGNSGGTAIKAWLDQKDGLAVKVVVTDGGQSMALVDLRSVSFAAPPASRFDLPSACKGVHPPSTAAEAIAQETGDSAANFVSAGFGPGSTNSCSIVLRVVRAGTMEPITRKFQVAIDTTYDVDHPPHYTFGVGEDGTSTFSGGAIHEITNQIHNGMVRIDNPPAYFNLALNVMTPHFGTGDTLIYRQCFAPVTVLYYVMKDQADPGKGGDYLYGKSGKYATEP
jgi:hypothetical protein